MTSFCLNQACYNAQDEVVKSLTWFTMSCLVSLLPTAPTSCIPCCSPFPALLSQWSLHPFPLMHHATGLILFLAPGMHFLWLLLPPWPLTPKVMAAFYLLPASLPLHNGASGKNQMPRTYSLTASCTFLIVALVHYLCNFCKLPQGN